MKKKEVVNICLFLAKSSKQALNSLMANKGTKSFQFDGKIRSLVSLFSIWSVVNFSSAQVNQLSSQFCGLTNVSMDQPLRSNNANVPYYKFRVTGLNHGGPGWVNNSFEYVSNNRAFKFDFIQGSVWGQTYTVEVALGDANLNFGSYGPSCNITLTAQIPTTQLQASQCGIQDLDASTNLFAKRVSGAHAYRFRVTGPNSANWTNGTFIITKPQRKLKMNELPGVLPGQIYSIQVAVQDALGTWGSYGPTCTVKMGCIHAQGVDVISSCSPITWIDGNTYMHSNNTATYTYVGGAANGCDSTVTLNYTFLGSHGVDVISSCDVLTWIDGNTYTQSNNTAIHIIQGGAANGCDSIVTLNYTLWPCLQLQSNFCGITDVTMDTPIRAMNIGVPAYRFRITGTNNGGQGWVNNSYEYVSNNRAFKFHFIPGSVWGSTYSVEVAAGDGLGNFGPYENACLVSLESTPAGQLEPTDCGATNVNPNANLFATAVLSAYGYKFRVNGAGIAQDTEIEKTMGGGAMRKLKMNEISGIVGGETYTVEVAVMDALGNWGPFGSACNVTLEGAPNIAINNDIEMLQNRDLELSDFTSTASQNPFTNDFAIVVTNANDVETISVKIYNMSGVLIESYENKPSDFESVRFGNNLAQGMYLIQVQQGVNQATLRQVKQ